MGNWLDLVTEKVEKMEKQRRADEEILEDLRIYLDDLDAKEKGITFDFKDNTGIVSYEGTRVFEARASDGQVLLAPEGAETESFQKEPDAHDRMATLVAAAIIKARDAKKPKTRIEDEDG